ncbi:hypothetical protein NMG60_11032834 [Bertholletia excelsa]
MEVNQESVSSRGADVEGQKQPLLEDASVTSGKPDKTPGQKAIRKSFKISAYLANLLPTGTVLAFQILSPALTHEGNCQTMASRYLTLVFLGLCCMSCFLLCFTDSFRDQKGKVRYGLATPTGLWVMDGSSTFPEEEAEKYKMKLVDFFHAFLSAAVFAAVAAFDKNVVKCLYPAPSEETQELLSTLPLAVGVISSMFFVAFPTQRHGVGFPLSKI